MTALFLPYSVPSFIIHLMCGQKKIVFGVIILILLLLPAGGRRVKAQQETDQPESLRVVTKVIEPFVFKEEERFTGFSIDLWNEISLRTGLPFEYIEVETVGEQLAALAEGEADIAIAAISMTPEREEAFDFSYPYFRSGLQILTTSDRPGLFQQLFTVLFSPRFLSLTISILVILIIVSHIIWLLERRNNPHFPRDYRRGVWEGLWWTVVTLTTVGYGDRTVKDKGGRLLAMVWMFAGIILLANFTAVVTAELTANRLESILEEVDDLKRRQVATVTGTTSADYLRQAGVAYIPVTGIEEAYPLLYDGRIDAIVYDAPVLQYYAATEGKGQVEVVGSPFKREDYGIALPPESPYEEVINQTLLEMHYDGMLAELANRWFISEE
jgi:ABC-type amino acid transport substrate-binding protein